jgi:hypothetical protein
MTHRRSRALVLASAAGVALTWPGQALAHVKWFCAFDVADQPRGLENVLCSDFEQLVGLSILALLLGTFIDGTAFGVALERALDRATDGLRANSETMIRAVCGFFFVSLFAKGGILLTPELQTSSELVPWLQLAIAAGLLSRRTLPLSGIGIGVLFAAAVANYGVFHLMDYPIFLGVAVYLMLTGLQRNLFGFRPLDIARAAAAVTLMWASVEKWAYPEWSFPLLIAHPAVGFGFEHEFFMRAAGVAEFTLAFGLIWTPLVRRFSAIILLGMFVGAILEFGRLDAIGHAVIIALLLAIVVDDMKRPEKVHLALAPLAYAGALAATLIVYYFGHSLLFNTTVLTRL